MELYLILGSIALIITVVIIITVIVKLYKSKIQSENLKLEINSNFYLEQITKLEQKVKDLTAQNDLEKEKTFQAIKEKELTELKLAESLVRLNDWEKSKEQAVEHAKAAIFEAGTKLSNKLFEEHKRETEQSKKASLDEFKENALKYNLQFENIIKQVAALDNQVKESKDLVDIVQRALLSPIGAGSLAEITLENILKASGLHANQDYFLQYVLGDSNNKQRPDAIIFLPNDNVMVIDSKASKFFIELARAETPEQEQLLIAKLKSSMKLHLKDLTTRDYKDGLKTHIKNLVGNIQVKHISVVMFLPSESALEKLQYLDSEFITRAWEQSIFPAGPVGIVNILAHAKFQISELNQTKNYHIIKDEVASLLSNIVNLFEHAKKLGNGLQSAVQNYDKFAASFNNHIIGRSKKLAKLGVTSKSSKTIPSYLERYQMITTEQIPAIEVEGIEPEDEVKRLEEN